VVGVVGVEEVVGEGMGVGRVVVVVGMVVGMVEVVVVEVVVVDIQEGVDNNRFSFHPNSLPLMKLL